MQRVTCNKSPLFVPRQRKDKFSKYSWSVRHWFIPIINWDMKGHEGFLKHSSILFYFIQQKCQVVNIQNCCSDNH
jgi:hypothetical protein